MRLLFDDPTAEKKTNLFLKNLQKEKRPGETKFRRTRLIYLQLVEKKMLQ